MNQSEMTAKIKQGDGFIAALDQSGGSTPKALKGYGVEEGAWASDEEMFGLIHQMRSRIITSPCFGGGKVIGAILFERTMDGTVDGKPTPQALIDQGVVPFIKIDKGLEAEENGVQMMKPMPDLDALLDARQGARRVRHQGALGHQLGECGGDCGARRPAVPGRQAGAGARPDADHRARGEHQERRPRRKRRFAPGRDPRGAGRDSGGPAGDAEAVDSRASRACSSRWSIIRRCCAWSRCRAVSAATKRARELAKNPGMIASFSRALLSDLRAQQSDEEFNRTLGTAIDEIYQASTRRCRPDLGRSRVRSDRISAAAADGAGEAVPDQPAGRRRVFPDRLKAALEPGIAAAFQLRVKDVDEHELARLAEPLQRICADAGVAFIVNDSMALAKRLGADGVHLGQSDGDIREARALLGPSAQIGKTCHDSRHLAMEAGEAGADYVAFGAFYPTTTKPSNYRPAAVDPDLVVDAVRNSLRRDRRDHARQCQAAWSMPARTSSRCARRCGARTIRRPRCRRSRRCWR